MCASPSWWSHSARGQPSASPHLWSLRTNLCLVKEETAPSKDTTAAPLLARCSACEGNREYYYPDCGLNCFTSALKHARVPANIRRMSWHPYISARSGHGQRTPSTAILYLEQGNKLWVLPVSKLILFQGFWRPGHSWLSTRRINKLKNVLYIFLID